MAMRLSVRAPVSRPAAVRSVRSASSRVPARRLLPVLYSSSADVSQKLESAVQEAKETCETGTTADCAVAWDTVEELSAEAKKKKEVEAANSDPLEQYCEGNPEADECRVYED